MTTKKVEKSLAPQKILDTELPLEIREPYTGETFFFTGNVYMQHSLVIQQFLMEAFPLEYQYRPVTDSVQRWAFFITSFCAYHQAMSDTGDHFAIPQDPNCSNSHQNGLEDLFEKPSQCWIRKVRRDNYETKLWEVGSPVKGAKFNRGSYLLQLAKAFIPLTITSVNHPFIDKFLPPFNELDDEDVPDGLREARNE